jgi:hypothetical protein
MVRSSFLTKWKVAIEIKKKANIEINLIVVSKNRKHHYIKNLN